EDPRSRSDSLRRRRDRRARPARAASAVQGAAVRGGAVGGGGGGVGGPGARDEDRAVAPRVRRRRRKRRRRRPKGSSKVAKGTQGSKGDPPSERIQSKIAGRRRADRSDVLRSLRDLRLR